ncbi:hypothetical protein FVE85_9849 [Porphyridium purpureum]|uniref:Uncharacterized protein n=1 Tax=Porphyridium purpureum TaxID=35688 RepID=A0A5J4YKB8_PORPP|nr:hypothetical protein FVE85_9849 [Porphyridium purpureum]|eukprot:POR0630..scf289_17
MTRSGASTRAANGDPAGKPAGTKRKRAFTYDHARHSVRLGLRVGKRDKQSGAPINVVCLFCEHLGRELTPVEIEDEERERLDANGPASSGGEEKRKAKRRKTGVEFLVRSFYVGNVKRHLERWHRTAFAEYERLFRSGGERAVARFFDPAPPVTVVTGYGEDANMFSTHTPSMPVERCEQAERPVHAPKPEHEPVHCHAQQPVGGGEMEQEFESPGSHEPDAYSTEFQKLCERVGEQELSFEQVAELVAKVAEKPEIYPLVLAKLPEHDVRGTGRTSLNTFVSALSFLKHHLV